MRLRRLLPGSLTSDGYVIDHRGFIHPMGPCWIPDDISPARKALLGAAGWCKCPAKDLPSLKPASGLVCIVWKPPF